MARVQEWGKYKRRTENSTIYTHYSILYAEDWKKWVVTSKSLPEDFRGTKKECVVFMMREGLERI